MLEKLSFINSWIRKEKVMDVILFGSVVRAKTKPGDIDLCIIINDKDEERSLDLVNSLSKIVKKIEKVQINILTAHEFTQGNSLAKTLLLEGISIKTKRKIAQMYGFENKSIFIYTLSHFTSSERVRFHYALKGRYGSEGILKKVEGEFWSSGTIVVPTSKEDLLKEFFTMWNVKYILKRGLIS